MARTEYSPEHFERIAVDLETAAQVTRAIASALREAGMPSSLIHGSTMTTVHIPAVQDWVGKARADSESQLRSYLAGIQSKAELHKHQTQLQKARAAKKPWPKKATKKKAT